MEGEGEDEFVIIDSEFDQFAKLKQEIKDLRNQCFPQKREGHQTVMESVKRLLNVSVLILLVLMTLPAMFVFFLQFRWILRCPPLPAEAVDKEGKPSDMMACELVLKTPSPTLGFFYGCLIILMLTSIYNTNRIVCSFHYIWSTLLDFIKGTSKSDLFTKLKQKIKDLRNQCSFQKEEVHRTLVQLVKFRVILCLLLVMLHVLHFLLQFHCPSLSVEVVDRANQLTGWFGN